MEADSFTIELKEVTQINFVPLHKGKVWGYYHKNSYMITKTT